MKRVLVSGVRVYQRVLSPILPGQCRYTPTCSEYFVVAVERYGILRGTWLGLKRIGRCRPGPGGGFGPDPVP